MRLFEKRLKVDFRMTEEEAIRTGNIIRTLIQETPIKDSNERIDEGSFIFKIKIEEDK